MATVIISGNEYTTYVSLTEANTYVAGVVGPGPTAWRASTDDDAKGRAVVSATRMVDRQPWSGTAVNGVSPALQWPRVGVTYADGTAVASSTVPQQVKDAVCELAALFMADQSTYSALDAGSNLRRAKADTVEVEFFVPTQGTGMAPPLPKVVFDLVGQFLGGAGSGGSTVSGTSDPCGASIFIDSALFTRNGQ